MRNNAVLLMEILWIVTGLICVFAGVRLAFTTGTDKIPIFAVMALICFVFAWIRHRQRKKS
jgi:ABC-type Mn2+/Zn2+ transport system permease subunit